MSNINRQYECPYLAGSSKSGKIVYIDKRLPKKLKLKSGRIINTDKYLNVHERVEKIKTDAGYSYQYAHELATAAERKAVEADKIPWDEYQNYMLGEVKKLQHLDGPVPKDMDLKPEKDSGDTKMTEKVKELQKAKPPEPSLDDIYDYGEHFGTPTEEPHDQHTFGAEPEGSDPFQSLNEIPEKASYFKKLLIAGKVKNYFRSKLPKTSK